MIDPNEDFKHVSLSRHDLKEIAIANKTSIYSDVLPFHLNMGFPIVNYNALLLRADEFMLYATPAYTWKDKERVVGYEGGSHGASIRIFRGFWLHRSARRGVPIRKNIREFTKGDLIITNQRIVFLAQTGAFELKVEKISSCQPIAKDAIMFQYGNITKNVYLERTEVLKYVYSCANASINSALKGYDLYTENENWKNSMSSEKEHVYERFKRKVDRIHVPKSSLNNSSGGIGFFAYLVNMVKKLIRFCFIIFILLLILAIFTADK